MNNIYEFAEQAAEHAVLNPSDEILQSESGDVTVQIPKAFVDKFAELIVQECCKITDEAERADVPVVASKFVKAHFGIDNA